MLKVELKNCLKFSTYSENITPKKIPNIVSEVPIITPIKKKILNYVKRALESLALKKERDYIENKLFHSFELIGKSPSISKVKKIVEKLNTSESRVLISGPSGSGKE